MFKTYTVRFKHTNNFQLKMDINFGNRAKELVEKYFKGSKKDFSEAMGFKQVNYLHEIFRKEDLGTDILKKMVKILGIDLSEFFVDPSAPLTLSEPVSHYGKKESEITKTLRQTIKAQEKTIASMEISLGLLQKQAGPQMQYTGTKK